MRLERPLFALILLGLIPPTGCSLKRTAPEKHYFVFEVSRPGGPEPGPPGISLQIREFFVSPRYEAKGFVYRTGDVSWEIDFYNEFFISPDNLLSEEVAEWLSHSGLFEQVTALSGLYEPTYGLFGRVNKLYGDYRDRGKPTAVLEIRFFIVEDPLRKPSLDFDALYLEEEPFDGTPAGLMRGWNVAFARILTALEADWRKRIR